MAGIQDFTGRVAVVTGGATGMGKGMARSFLAEGAIVVLADVEQAALDATAAELGVLGVRTDVTRAEDLENLAAEVMKRYGRVDILCNNAGVCPIVSVAEATIEDWRWAVDVNFWGVVHGIRAFLPHLLANPHGGHIFNNTAGAGLVGVPWIGPYSAAKAAAISVSVALDAELKEKGAKVGVTAFCPGAVGTDIATSARNRPPELANTADRRAAGTQPAQDEAALQRITSDSVGRITIDAIRRGALYATTHDHIADIVEGKMQVLLADLRHPRPPVDLFIEPGASA